MNVKGDLSGCGLHGYSLVSFISNRLMHSLNKIFLLLFQMFLFVCVVVCVYHS